MTRAALLLLAMLAALVWGVMLGSHLGRCIHPHRPVTPEDFRR